MKQTFRLFSMAVLALVMGACSEEDNAVTQQPDEGVGIPFEATISTGSDNVTRTVLTEITSGDHKGEISVAWKVGDKIALIHNSTIEEVEVTSITDGQATISGKLKTAPANGDDVYVAYPYEAVDRAPYHPGIAHTTSDTYKANLKAQDGTLDFIAEHLDTRGALTKFAVDGESATLSSSVKLYSTTAIWKLSLKDMTATGNPTPALAATKLTIKDKKNNVFAETTEFSEGKSEITVAISGWDDEDVVIEATKGNDTYVFAKDDLTLTEGKYYQSPVNMYKKVELTTTTGALTLNRGEMLTGTGGADTHIKIAKGASVLLYNMTNTSITNDANHNWAGIECLGDATIAIEGTNEVKGGYGNYPGIFVPEDYMLTIGGTGSLEASTNTNGNAAGIGGSYQTNCGRIVINGGTIKANGGSTSAGIGGGGYANCGDIEITGGKITAKGGDNGAGIGGSSEASCEAIYISGGVIDATGGANAAGIGSGNTGYVWDGDIEITGGKITAEGGANAAGIGSGRSGGCENISISGNTTWIKATAGDNAAGIGSGYKGKFKSITIAGNIDKVIATQGVNALAPIGKGSDDAGSGNVTIDSEMNPTATTTFTHLKLTTSNEGKTWTLVQK